MRKAFTATFNHAVCESSVRQFAYWDEIQSREVSTAFSAYLNSPELEKKLPGDSALLRNIMAQGGIVGVATEAHERWEVLEFLKKGYSVEEISSGKAHEEYSVCAHATARLKELKLYQFLYQHMFVGRTPALRTFLYVNPLLKIVVQDLYKADVNLKLMTHFLNELREHKSIVVSEKACVEDVENSIRFFESGGYDYGDHRCSFLERGLVFLMELG